MWRQVRCMRCGVPVACCLAESGFVSPRRLWLLRKRLLEGLLNKHRHSVGDGRINSVRGDDAIAFRRDVRKSPVFKQKQVLPCVVQPALYVSAETLDGFGS